MGVRAGGGARGGGGGGFGGKTERGLTVQEARTLLAEEAGIRGNNFETAVVVDANGNIVWKKKGGKASVVIDDSTKLTNNILTHNHPAIGTDVKGRPLAHVSFSDKDIITAVSSNAKGIRVITQGGTHFSLMRPEGGWGVSSKNIGRVVGQAKRLANKQLKGYFDGYHGAHRYTAGARVEQVYWHRVTQILASEYGWKYTKSKA